MNTGVIDTQGSSGGPGFADGSGGAAGNTTTTSAGGGGGCCIWLI